MYVVHQNAVCVCFAVVLAAILAVFGGITLYASFTTLTKLRSNGAKAVGEPWVFGCLKLQFWAT